ncbi:MAG TPA: hypothetical protein VL572_07055 [Pyrinomonadaceae bacterium]|nr:hypothetical protein [Pyrinomonadaceae bacterium]
MLKRLTIATIFLLTVSSVLALGQDLPKPKLALVRVDDAVSSGRRFRMYTIEILNRSEFADELFAPSPDLPPCGRNADSSRTWINIYIDDGTRIYGHCGIRTNAELSSLKFNIPADTKQPSRIYIDLVDRREGKVVRSNKVDVEN